MDRLLLSGVLDLLRRPGDRDRDLLLLGDLDFERLCFALDFFFFSEDDLDFDFLSSFREDDLDFLNLEDDFDLDLTGNLDFEDCC